MTVTRRMDDLGRIVIPKEIREAMQLKVGEALDVSNTYDGKIILEKTQPINSDGTKIAIADNRKMCIIKWDYNEEEAILLTEDQIRLLDWLSERDFLDGNVTWGKYEKQEIKVI